MLTSTLAFVYICAAVVTMAGRVERPIFGPKEKLPHESSFGVLLSLAGVFLIVWAYLSGDLGFEGVQIDANSQRIPVLGATAILITAPLVGLFGYLYGKFDAKFLRLYCAIAGSIVLVSIVPFGRRQIALALILLILGYSLSGRLRQLSLLQKLMMAAIVFATGLLVSSYFFAVRLSSWELGPNSPFLDQLSLALEFVTSSALEERFSALLYDNLRERTFVLGYLADLIEATRNSGPLYGEALLFYLRLSIPSALDPSKVDVLAVQQVENFTHPKLGLPAIDQANTILTDGVTDFGLAGGFVYLVGIIAVLYASAWLFRKFGKPFASLIAGFTLIHLALRPEITLSEYLVSIRNLIWIIPLIFVCEYFWGTVFSPKQPRLYNLPE
jgi:hypothetical protein